MKKLLIFFILASSLPMVGMDTSEDPKSTKRPLDDDKAEVSAAKKQKTKENGDQHIDGIDDIFSLEEYTDEDEARVQFHNKITEHNLIKQRDIEREKARKKVFQAIKDGNIAALSIALTDNPDIETPYIVDGNDIGTALQYALSDDDHVSLPIIQTLVEYGANPNVSINEESIFTVIFRLSREDSDSNFFAKKSPQSLVDFVQLLIDRKADVNEEYEGHTPLLTAISLCRKPQDFTCVKKLLDAGADANRALDMHRYEGGNTALHFIMMHQPLDRIPKFINLLFKNKNNTINSRNTYGETPLLILCKVWEESSTQYDDDVFTSVGEHVVTSLRLLMQAGADETIADDEGCTPIGMLSKSCNHDDTPTCTECGINHACTLCSINQKMLGAIQEHQVYRQKAPVIIRNALYECQPKGAWRDPASIIASYVTAIAPSPLQQDPMILGDDTSSSKKLLSLEMPEE